MTARQTEAAKAALAAVLSGTLAPAQAAAQYGISPGHLRRMLREAGAPDRRRNLPTEGSKS